MSPARSRASKSSSATSTPVSACQRTRPGPAVLQRPAPHPGRVAARVAVVDGDDSGRRRPGGRGPPAATRVRAARAAARCGPARGGRRCAARRPRGLQLGEQLPQRGGGRHQRAVRAGGGPLGLGACGRPAPSSRMQRLRGQFEDLLQGAHRPQRLGALRPPGALLPVTQTGHPDGDATLGELVLDAVQGESAFGERGAQRQMERTVRSSWAKSGDGGVLCHWLHSSGARVNVHRPDRTLHALPACSPRYAGHRPFTWRACPFTPRCHPALKRVDLPATTLDAPRAASGRAPLPLTPLSSGGTPCRAPRRTPFPPQTAVGRRAHRRRTHPAHRDDRRLGSAPRAPATLPPPRQAAAPRAAKRLGVSMQAQEQTNWCWAGSRQHHRGLVRQELQPDPVLQRRLPAASRAPPAPTTRPPSAMCRTRSPGRASTPVPT